jgi:hypothetical protein
MTKQFEGLAWRLSSPSAALTAALAAFMLSLGVRTLIDPRGAAVAYGMPLSSRRDIPWMYTKAGRDLGIAAALAAILATRQRRAAGLFVLASTLMPIADAVNVIRRKRVRYALAVHGSAAALTLVLGSALLRRGHGVGVASPPPVAA